MGILIYRFHPDTKEDTYNPVAFKLDDGTIKTTSKNIGLRIKDMSIDEIEDSFNNGQTFKTRRYTDETVLKIMRKAE